MTVSKLNNYIKSVIDSDIVLTNVCVSGEISNFKAHSSGHAYFTLKDNSSSIKCVMFKSYFSKVKFVLENGMKVIIKGSVSVYERDGQYQIYCAYIAPDGMGALHLAFEQLKTKLSEKGWFDVHFKKPIPKAAIKDILNVASRRFYGVDILVVPVLVQGEGAAEEISKAIYYLNKLNSKRSSGKNIDVLILARGGGSIEDLWCFNEEIVAKSIFESKIPIVSAIGHEIDFTIADFVSDLRAPTPSAAAELVVPEFKRLENDIFLLKSKMYKIMETKVSNYKLRYDIISKNRFLKNPKLLINERYMLIDNLKMRAIRNIDILLKEKKNDARELSNKLELLNPAFMVSRGYSIVKNNDGKVIKTIKDIQVDGQIEVNLSDGRLNCKVINIEENSVEGNN
jgi:exodeoxyribonuclease VII large subunit